MTITNIVMEDNLILITVQGHPTRIIVENHIDNRNLLKTFNKLKILKNL